MCMTTRITKGDKVRSAEDGPLMDVLAASDTWAICEWIHEGSARVDLFEVARLKKLAVQQAQPPQPPDEDGKPA